MSDVFDRRQVRRAFSRSAASYRAAATLQREVESRLLECLDYLDDPAVAFPAPRVVLDLGCGPGHASAAMKRRWPRARVVACDLALPMLREARRASGWLRPVARVCGDARALPLAEGSVDVLFSNLCLQWVEDLPAVLAGFRRVLRPGGRLLLSSFGPQTLHELRDAFAQADDAPHVSPFADIAQWGDALVAAGFRDPVLDRDLLVERHPDLATLMRGLKALGATNALAARRHALTGRSRFAAAERAYRAAWADPNGRLPASWEVVYAQAWAPQPGAPVREGGIETANFPASALKVRRR